jgi:hypothetical protein
LLPHWDMKEGVCDNAIFESFAGGKEEQEAWDRYLEKHIPLNTGSYGLLGRGLYELQLRQWLKEFKGSQDSFLVLTLESLNDVQATMQQVWKHVDLPSIDVQDATPKNTRDYDPSLGGDDAARNGKKNDTAAVATPKRQYLQNFYAPYNQRLQQLLQKHGWGSHSWTYDNDGESEFGDEDVNNEIENENPASL